MFELEQAIWGYGSSRTPCPSSCCWSRRGSAASSSAHSTGTASSASSTRCPGSGTEDRSSGRTCWASSPATGVQASGGGSRPSSAGGDGVRTGPDCVDVRPASGGKRPPELHETGSQGPRVPPDAYPGSWSTLHAGTPTDRFIAEWWLRSERAVQRMEAVERGGIGRPRGAGLGAAVPVNGVREGGRSIAPGRHDLSVDARHLAVTIPTGFTEMQERTCRWRRPGGWRPAKYSQRTWRAATRWWISSSTARPARDVPAVSRVTS